MRQCLQCNHFHGIGRKSKIQVYANCKEHQDYKCVIDQLLELLPLVETMALTIAMETIIKSIEKESNP